MTESLTCVLTIYRHGRSMRKYWRIRSESRHICFFNL